MIFIFLIVGFAVLITGAWLLVKGASKLAFLLGISRVVVGLTVVAYGTSTPELAVSAKASLLGQPDMALGNAIGSNIFNILFVLGIAAMIVPISIDRQILKLHMPVMIGSIVVLYMLAIDGVISNLDGFFLFIAFIFYTIYLIYHAKKDRQKHNDDMTIRLTVQKKERIAKLGWSIVSIIAGLGLLIIGSDILVKNAIELAHFMGVRELVIGLTIVAAGTSLPEAATSIIASIKGENEISCGNIVGSNIFNIIVVLAFAGMLSRDGLTVAPASIHLDIPVVIAASIMCIPIFITGLTITRFEGFLFFAFYVLYTVNLILHATEHKSADYMTAMIPVFVIACALITVLIPVLRGIKRRD